MGIGGDFIEFLEREILCLGARGELFEAQVNGVGTVVKSGEGGVQAPRRRQQFDRRQGARPSDPGDRERHFRLSGIVSPLGQQRFGLRIGDIGKRAGGGQTLPAGNGAPGGRHHGQ